MIAALGITCGILALGMAGLAIRISGMKGEVERAAAAAARADTEREQMQIELGKAAHEFKSELARKNAQMTALRANIATLEKDLQADPSPTARRKRIEGLFDKASET